jgi:hypothetical protein
MGLKDLFDRPGKGGDTLLRTALEPTLQPGEELVGMLMATRRSGMKPQTYALGVTGDRIILAPTSAKDGLPTLSLARSDITGSSVKHMGLGVRLLSDANASRVTIQSRTQGEVKLTLILDDIAERVVKGGPPPGVAALENFLSTTP